MPSTTPSSHPQNRLPLLAALAEGGEALPEPERAFRALGIDLGTTNSAVAEVTFLPGSRPAMRQLEFEQHSVDRGVHTDVLVPSILALRDGQPLVGFGAKELRARLGELGLQRESDIFWECKNDIGVRRTYHRAPDGFRSATDITGHVLRFLTTEAIGDADEPVESIVVTVPASFQAAQRKATTDAARLAGVELLDGALLDEPIAALIAHIVANGSAAFGQASGSCRLVVFDFGGGTCDIAVLALDLSATPIGVAPLAVSRYHRLGGGDIDRAIVDLVLVPQLIDQNALDAHALSYRDKAERVFPALLGVAEALKVGLSNEVARLIKFGRYEAERPSLVQKNPGHYACTLMDGRALTLRAPTLSALQFDALLQPFLDRTLLYPRETEYRLTCSIFAPLQDALERAGALTPEEIDYCLLVGGSSCLPQVGDALKRFFPNASLLQADNTAAAQTAVAEGAAWQALSLALYGEGIFHVVASDSIGIKTMRGKAELISTGTPLPFPPAPGDWEANDELTVPADGPVDIRVELRNAGDALIYRESFSLPSTYRKGDPLHVQYRMDGNQVFHLSLAPRDAPEDRLRAKIESPFTHVVNPNAKRDKVLELEESMRVGGLTPQRQRATVSRIADLHVELGMREKAIDLLANLNRSQPDASVLFKMAFIAGEMGDHQREEQYYREAARLGENWNAPFFNLALSYRRRNDPEAAMKVIDECTDLEADPPSLVLKALLAERLGWSVNDRRTLLEQAHNGFDPVTLLDDFELGWYLVAAGLAQQCGVGNPWSRRDAEEERKRRRLDPPDEDKPRGVLPGRQ